MTDITNNFNPSRIDLLALSIKRERQAAGLSLTELAKRAGVAKSTLSQLESGIGNPSIETLWSLATAMGLQVTRFFEQPQQNLRVIRANEGPTTSTETGNYTAPRVPGCRQGGAATTALRRAGPLAGRYRGVPPPGNPQAVSLRSCRFQ